VTNMNISVWKPIAFFLFILLLGYFLLPTGREMGRILSQGNKRSAAFIHLERQYHQNPLDQNNSLRYIRGLLENGDYKRFEKVGIRLTQLFPDAVELNSLLADFYQGIYVFKKAAHFWVKMVPYMHTQLEKEELMEKYVAYLIYDRQYDVLEALYEQQYKEKSMSLATRYEYADLLLQLKKDQKALKIYEHIIREYPAENNAVSRKIDIMRYRGEYELLVDQILSTLPASGPTNSVSSQYIEIVSYLNNNSDKVHAYERFLTLRDNRRIRLELSVLLKMMNRYTQSLHHLNKIKESKLNRKQVWALKGELYYLVKKYKNAAFYLSAYRKIYPINDYYIEILMESYVHNNDTTEALATADTIVKKRQTNVELLMAAARVYSDFGKQEKAIETLVAYHERMEGDYSSHHLLGDLYADIGKSRKSREEYKKALRYIREK